MEKNGNDSLKTGWSLLFWTGVLFCFLLFPIFLLDIGLESYIKTKNEIEKNSTYRKLELSLEKLLQYKDSSHYYHALLKKIFDIAEEQSNPVEYLEKAILNLKDKNPETFSFVVWSNESNKIIDSLTDEKGYKYVLKTINSVIRAICEENRNNYPVEPKELSIVNEKFEIMRSYIGNRLVPESLNLPLLKANLGKIIPVSAFDNKYYFWFQSGKKLTMIVSIARAATKSNDYAKRLVNSINQAYAGKIKFGMMDFLSYESIIPERDEARVGELKLALAKYENYSNPKIDTDSYIVLIKIFNPFIRVFCYFPKKEAYTSPELRKNFLIATTSVILMISLGILILYRFTKYNFSMRWKLSLIFLYANGLPLIALGFIGYDYLQQNRNLQVDSVHDEISRLINDFDSKFGEIKNQYSSRLNAILDKINANFSTKKNIDNYLDDLKQEALQMKCDDINIIDKNGKSLIPSNVKLNTATMQNIVTNVLKFINNEEYTPLVNAGVINRSEPDSFASLSKGIFLHEILSKVANINLEQILDNANYYYFNFIGDFNDRNFTSMVAISWSLEQLQENYVREYLKGLNENRNKIKFVAFSEKYGKIFPETSKEDQELINKFRQVLNLNSLGFEELVLDGKKYSAYGSIGRELSNTAIIGFFPMDIIDKRNSKILLRLTIFIFTSSMLTLGISWILSAKFLEPIRDLNLGIKEMGRQNFAYRLPIKSSDEFGTLSLAFNSAFDSLQDLDVAATVQKNLFPLKPLRQNKVLVCGKSVSMTRLGGDYFDFFSLDENEIGVLIGDVSGHGVPAGFLMAMAKASVILSCEDKKYPEKLLSSLHKVFKNINKANIKRMMTCIYFCINTKTGEYKVANAGHCFPVIINGKNNISFLELVGFPLGVSKKAKYQHQTGRLEENGIVLLYTDGILEARNEAGKFLGMEGFSKIISQSYSEDLEEFYKNIFLAYKNWSLSADDDITIVLLKFGSETDGNIQKPFAKDIYNEVIA